MIEAMAARWGSAPALLGFGLLNEPKVCRSLIRDQWSPTLTLNLPAFLPVRIHY